MKTFVILQYSRGTAVISLQDSFLNLNLFKMIYLNKTKIRYPLKMMNNFAINQEIHEILEEVNVNTLVREKPFLNMTTERKSLLMYPHNGVRKAIRI